MSTAVLLINLGTPSSPHPKDVYRYLIEFLTDERVIDTSWLKRQLLVRGFIVPKRYKSSAKAYSSIWSSEGSPLMVHSKNLKEKLQQHLGEEYHVSLAMRYQEPSIEATVNSLLMRKPEKLLIVPLFPQYASATTGTVHQKVMEVLKNAKVFPKIVFLNHFAAEPALIDAYKEIASSFDVKHYDHILFSFHGLPKKQLTDCNKSCFSHSHCCKSNSHCYAAQCYKMADALVKSLQIPTNKQSVSFQSRLGSDPWLEPYTSETLLKLAKEGKKSVLVFCPSFVSDCLETIFEIGVECKQEFIHAGGSNLELVPGLNDHPAWVKALGSIIRNA